MSTVSERDVALVDLLDRLLGGGVVIAGGTSRSLLRTSIWSTSSCAR